MRLQLLTALALLTLGSAATAQQTKRLLDSIMIHSDAAYNVDRPIFRVFGFGGEYTDTVDYRLPSATRERMIPGPPPASLYAMFDAQHVAEPTWIDRDVRGVPDSVAAGTATNFSLRYILEIQRGTGSDITLVMPRALPRGIDSINFRDIIGGTGGFIFNETITAGPDSVLIPNEGLHTIAMIVYYDANNVSTSVPLPIAGRAADLRLVPNPALDHVAIDTELPAGSRIVLSDVRGRAVMARSVLEASSREAIAVDGLVDGLYFVRAVAPDGAILAESRLVVRR